MLHGQHEQDGRAEGGEFHRNDLLTWWTCYFRAKADLSGEHRLIGPLARAYISCQRFHCSISGRISSGLPMASVPSGLSPAVYLALRQLFCAHARNIGRIGRPGAPVFLVSGRPGRPGACRWAGPGRSGRIKLWRRCQKVLVPGTRALRAAPPRGESLPFLRTGLRRRPSPPASPRKPGPGAFSGAGLGWGSPPPAERAEGLP